jgi:hypothetical protein
VPEIGHKFSLRHERWLNFFSSMLEKTASDLNKWQLLTQRVNERAAALTTAHLAEVGIEAVLFKGWSVARFYPTSTIRTYGDIDIAVDPVDYPRAVERIRTGPTEKLGIDLHEGFRDRDTLPWSNIYSRTYTVDLDGKPVRVLGEEDQLRMVAAHWLIDGGLFQDKLWDIYYLVENRKPDFDWSLSVGAAGPIRRTWVISAIATARDYLDLDLAGVPEEIVNFKLPNWYVQALKQEWSKGPYLRLPILSCLKRPKVLFEQVSRRFPPNPIAATTDAEGPIDESPRLRYQVKSILKKVRSAAL